MYVFPGNSILTGTSFIPSNKLQSERSSCSITPDRSYSLSVKQRVTEGCAKILESVFFNNHLHCAGVSATRLSAGIFPSQINPITSIGNFFALQRKEL